MIDTLKTLLLQVLTMSPKGVGLSGKLQTNPRKNSHSLDFARIKCLPKRLLSAAMVADFSFGLTTTFAAMSLNVGRLFFFKGE